MDCHFFFLSKCLFSIPQIYGLPSFHSWSRQPPLLQKHLHLVMPWKFGLKQTQETVLWVWGWLALVRSCCVGHMEPVKCNSKWQFSRFQPVPSAASAALERQGVEKKYVLYFERGAHGNWFSKLPDMPSVSLSISVHHWRPDAIFVFVLPTTTSVFSNTSPEEVGTSVNWLPPVTRKEIKGRFERSAFCKK